MSLPTHTPSLTREHNETPVDAEYTIDGDQNGNIEFVAQQIHISVDTSSPSVSFRLSDEITFWIDLGELLATLGGSIKAERP